MAEVTRKQIASFYDEFSSKLLDSYLYGNARLDRAIARVQAQITPEVHRILDVGCGIGVSTGRIADSCPGVELLGVDISAENIRIASALFGAKRVSFRVSTLDDGAVQGPFDLITMIDVYEHIPLHARPALQSSLRALLADEGRLVLAVPSPLHQQHLKEHHPYRLQIVDEVITVEDAVALAKAVRGSLMTFEYVSVWRSNDYVHVVIQRNPRYESCSSAPRGVAALPSRLGSVLGRIRRRAEIRRKLGVHLPLRIPKHDGSSR